METSELQISILEEKLRTALLESGLTYSEVQQQTDIPLPTISRFINRQRRFSVENFVRLAEALELDLVGKDGTPIVAKPDLRPRSQGRIRNEKATSRPQRLPLPVPEDDKVDALVQTAAGKIMAVQAKSAPQWTLHFDPTQIVSTTVTPGANFVVVTTHPDQDHVTKEQAMESIIANAVAEMRRVLKAQP